MSDVTTKYTIEYLTEVSVNILFTYCTVIEDKEYEIKKSRISYSNSNTGRQKLVSTLPEQYANAVLTIWGDTPIVPDPDPNIEDIPVSE